MPQPLSLFAFAQSGTVLAVNTDSELQDRLMGMGLYAGARFRLLQGGSGQSQPLVIAIDNTRIALGASVAAMILVE